MSINRCIAKNAAIKYCQIRYTVKSYCREYGAFTEEMLRDEIVQPMYEHYAVGLGIIRLYWSFAYITYM